MRKALGIMCMILGIVCLLSAIGLVFYNQAQARNAEAASTTILQEYRQQTLLQPTQQTVPQPTQQTEPVLSAENGDETPLLEESARMPIVSLQGHDCIGVLSIPVLELELPVLANWTYPKLKIAPCQYYGNCYDTDFVIAAHNYAAHFGRLSLLQPGDLVLFTDTTGAVFCYQVTLLETLAANATEEMITSGFDLSLYTCTPGGASRVTARCVKVDPTQLTLP